MVHGTRAGGKKINSTERVLRPGQTALVTRETTSMAKSTDMGALRGRIIVPTQATSLRIISKGMVFITGVMEGCTREPGEITRWRATEYSSGLMVAVTRVSILMIRRRAAALSFGLMVANTKGSGVMESKTELELTQRRVGKQKLASGKRASALLGYDLSPKDTK